MRNEPRVRAETDLGGAIFRVAQERFVNTPAHLRKNLLQFCAQTFARGRVCFVDQEGEAIAALRCDLRAQLVDVRAERSEVGRLPALDESFRARRVVKIEHGCLGKSVGRAATPRMERIAFQLDRTSVDGRRDQRNCSSSARHCRRVIEKFSRNGPLDTFRKWNQMRFGPAAAVQSETRQRHRCAHQLQEAAPRPFVAVELRRASRKFALQPFAKLWRVAQFAHATPVTLSS